MKNKKKVTILLIISGALTLAICAVMNLYLIPAIESSTQGIRCFDMNFGYSYEKATQFLQLLSEEGSNIYLTRQLPLDFFYPIAYGLFFSLLLLRLGQNRKIFLLFPILLMVSDYCENVHIYMMLNADASALPQLTVSIASAATMVKTVLMYVCILLILVLLVKNLINRRKIPDKSSQNS